MIALLIIALTVSTVMALSLLVLVGPSAFRAVRRRRLEQHLRGNWWPEFEHAFRDYERRCSEAARENE
jgi:hypothetical protein